MVAKRARGNSKTKSISSAVISAQRLTQFAPPQLLEGEDANAYDELHSRVCAAVKPADIMEELLIADVISGHWEAVRWQRLKTTLLRGVSYNELESFLNEAIDYELYRKGFEQAFAEALQDSLGEDQQADNFVKNLARQFAAGDPDTIARIRVLGRLGEFKAILDGEKAEKARELAQDYARKVPTAVKLVNKCLASHGRMMDGFAVDALVDRVGTSRIDCLAAIERMDRLASIAEARRNASFREIDRHRQELSEALRRSLQTIEDGEFQVIEPTPVQEDSAA
jgi:hypothetical protein